jgi:hypothetical protein
MHIHGNPINTNMANLHSSAAAEKAATAERASETRKKLMKSAVKIEGELDSESSFMIGQWSEEGSRQRQSENHDHVPNKTQIAGEEQTDTPVSIWA